MSRRAALWALGVALLVAFGFLLGGGDYRARSSTLSRDPGGWLAARAYLEARGARTELIDRPLAPAEDAVLVLTFPWQRAAGDAEIEAVGEHLRRGGTVLLAYSGELGDLREERLLDALGLVADEIRPPPPLAPRRWWAYRREVWDLAPEGLAAEGLATEGLATEGLAAEGPGAAGALRVAAFRAAPGMPDRGRPLARRASDARPLVFDYPLHRGRVVVLPAALLSNAWLGAGTNADLLETLYARLGDGWRFDEYHHGLVGVEAAPAATSRFAWDLLMVHLALLYLLGLAAAARRFGPAWRPAPVTLGSTASYLRGLGVLHHKLRHHRDAARLLVERMRTYDPALELDADPEVADARGLVALARRLATDIPRRKTP